MEDVMNNSACDNCCRVLCKRTDKNLERCFGNRHRPTQNIHLKKDTKMKPQFTEEEAIQFIVDCFPYHMGIAIMNIKDLGIAYAKKAKENGYIRKSDLEILIEEAEKAYDNFAHEYDNPGVDTSWSNTVACIKSQQRCIKAMKTELNKRKDK